MVGEPATLDPEIKGRKWRVMTGGGGFRGMDLKRATPLGCLPGVDEQNTDCTGQAYRGQAKGPVASKQGNLRSLLNASSMALGSMTGRQRHGVGKGGYRERGGEQTQGAGETRNGNGTAKSEGGELGREKGTKGGGQEKVDRWWGARTRTRGSTKEKVPIKFSTYNIRNGRNGGLESALRGMAQANIDLGVFQEMKCRDGIYTRESAVYCVVATDALSQHCGGVALIYRPSSLFAVEAVRDYGPNMLSFEVATGGRRWYIIGCYFAPDNARTIERVVTVLGDQLRDTATSRAVLRG